MPITASYVSFLVHPSTPDASQRKPNPGAAPHAKRRYVDAVLPAVLALVRNADAARREDGARMLRALVSKCSTVEAVDRALDQTLAVLRGSEGKLTQLNQRVGMYGALAALCDVRGRGKQVRIESHIGALSLRGWRYYSKVDICGGGWWSGHFRRCGCMFRGCTWLTRRALPQVVDLAVKMTEAITTAYNDEVNEDARVVLLAGLSVWLVRCSAWPAATLELVTAGVKSKEEKVRRAFLHTLLAACAVPELLLAAVGVVQTLQDHVVAGQVKLKQRPNLGFRNKPNPRVSTANIAPKLPAPSQGAEES